MVYVKQRNVEMFENTKERIFKTKAPLNETLWKFTFLRRCTKSLTTP